MKKYRIACCDDDKKILDLLKEYFTTISVQSEVTFEVDYFFDGEELLKKYQPGGIPYEILLLDMELEDVRGLELAREIREYDNKVVIMFLTSYPEYMRGSFRVVTFSYMEKPISYEFFSDEILRAMRYIESDEENIVLVSVDREEFLLRLSEIQYMEKVKRLAFMEVVTNDRVYTIRASIKNLEQRLTAKHFVRISRSCIVNMRYLHKIMGNEAELINGTRLPMSRRKIDKIKESVYKYSFLDLR